ncbi:invasion associated locus B family protein [Aestuariivirga sp.]|uniref:invasion associated locus B family protein n=1 Tax=Aestuariivirga sp. TaxID=2650926 RepID=UPI0039E54EDC
MIPAVRTGLAALSTLALVGCACTNAHAQTSTEPTLLGQFEGWAAYTYKAKDTKVCYISARPKSSDPKTAKRDPAFFLVTNMPGRKVKGEISTIIGYAFKKDSNATLKIDDASFTLFTNADGAWADTAQTEKKIVTAMKGGKLLTLKGTSWKGTSTTDIYALDGVGQALAKIDDACK